MRQSESAYVCGPLTELSLRKKRRAKRLYVRIADLCQEVLGARAFVPHEHYDPKKHAHFTPAQVDTAERHQIRNHTTHLVVVALEPTWGGGIEVEMANRYGVPAFILVERGKLEARKISRLLRGNPAVQAIIAYDTEEEAIRKLRAELTKPIAA
ncbi:MAG: hypothetical protein PHI63_03425 [Patescibacteria group bacterium]|nr:hypothetical protein [Patescibacteria group bacterium]